MIQLGSLFAGIGGFDLGARWAFGKAGIDHNVAFQVEQNKFCQRILKKHWPDAQLFDDVRTVGRHNLPDVDILMGGFPCQDISQAGLQKGIFNGKKSSLWFEMLRIISELRPRIIVLENVAAIIRVGGPAVVGSLAEIGYDCEWSIISAAQFGAPHLRKRWFCVATDTHNNTAACPIQTRRPIHTMCDTGNGQTTNTGSAHAQRDCLSIRVQKRYAVPNQSVYPTVRAQAAWRAFPTQPPLCSRDDGVSDRVARLKALGNAIVPQCAEYIFDHIIASGVLAAPVAIQINQQDQENENNGQN